jgi:epoxide hydrolase-like predicted phosphatase
VNGERVLVCDFGGVLTTPLERSFRIWSEESDVPLEALGAALAKEAERSGAHPLHELERGRLTEKQFLGALTEHLSEAMGRPVDMSRFGEAYFEHLDVNEELLDRLRAWHGDGLRMALCTNNVREWEARWRAMIPVDDLFETVVDSAFVGVRKPDREIYEIVLERLGDVPAEACVFLDDFEVNCDGARAVGMAAVRFVSNEQAIPEVEDALGVRSA